MHHVLSPTGHRRRFRPQRPRSGHCAGAGGLEGHGARGELAPGRRSGQRAANPARICSRRGQRHSPAGSRLAVLPGTAAAPPWAGMGAAARRAGASVRRGQCADVPQPGRNRRRAGGRRGCVPGPDAPAGRQLEGLAGRYPAPAGACPGAPGHAGPLWCAWPAPGLAAGPHRVPYATGTGAAGRAGGALRVAIEQLGHLGLRADAGGERARGGLALSTRRGAGLCRRAGGATDGAGRRDRPEFACGEPEGIAPGSGHHS